MISCIYIYILSVFFVFAKQAVEEEPADAEVGSEQAFEEEPSALGAGAPEGTAAEGDGSRKPRLKNKKEKKDKKHKKASNGNRQEIGKREWK